MAFLSDLKKAAQQLGLFGGGGTQPVQVRPHTRRTVAGKTVNIPRFTQQRKRRMRVKPPERLSSPPERSSSLPEAQAALHAALARPEFEGLDRYEAFVNADPGETIRRQSALMAMFRARDALKRQREQTKALPSVSRRSVADRRAVTADLIAAIEAAADKVQLDPHARDGLWRAFRPRNEKKLRPHEMLPAMAKNAREMWDGYLGREVADALAAQIEEIAARPGRKNSAYLLAAKYAAARAQQHAAEHTVTMHLNTVARYLDTDTAEAERLTRELVPEGAVEPILGVQAAYSGIKALIDGRGEPERGRHWGSVWYENTKEANPYAIATVAVRGSRTLRDPYRKMDEVEVWKKGATHVQGELKAALLHQGISRWIYAQQRMAALPAEHGTAWRGMAVPAATVDALVSGAIKSIPLTGCTAFSMQPEIAAHYSSSEWTQEHSGGDAQAVLIHTPRSSAFQRSIGMFHPNKEHPDDTSLPPFELLSVATELHVQRTERRGDVLHIFAEVIDAP